MLDGLIDGIGNVLRAIGPIDGICLAIVTYFALKGLFKGLLRQVALLGTLLIGFTLSKLFAGDVASWIPTVYSKAPSQETCVYIAYFLIFITTFVALLVVIRFMRKVLEAADLMFLDRVLGFAAGALVGGLLSSVALTAALMLPPYGPGEEIHNLIRESRSLHFIAKAVPHMRFAFPEEFVARGEKILDQQKQEDERRQTVPKPGPETIPPTEPEKGSEAVEGGTGAESGSGT